MKPVVLAAAAALLAACSGGSESEDTVYRSEEGTVTTSGEGDDATTVVEGADGSGAVVGAGAAAAVSGPDWARPYPGSRVVSAIDIPAEGGGMTTFETTANPDTVIAYYRERAADAGLPVGATMTTGDMRQYAAQADNGQALTVIVTPNEGRSSVNVTWQQGS
jgi:hypothetical protein